MSDISDPELDLVFAALSDPTRRLILGRLLEGELPVGDLAEPLPMSLAAVSKHIQILSRAGLASQQKKGRIRTCRLEPDAMQAAFVWMQGFGRFAFDDYDLLEQYVAAALADGPISVIGDEEQNAAQDDTIDNVGCETDTAQKPHHQR